MAAVIAVVAVFGVRYYTIPNGKEGKYMNPASVVATVDDQKISIGMFDYYYASIVSYYEQYRHMVIIILIPQRIIQSSILPMMTAIKLLGKSF